MGIITLGSALAIGLSGLGVALGQGKLSKTSMEILGEKPELGSDIRVFTILGIALVESVVIYGFIVAFQILGTNGLSNGEAIGAGLVVGLTAFGTGLGQGNLVSGAINSFAINPENKNMILQFMILFVALVESVAIYGLVVAQKILG